MSDVDDARREQELAQERQRNLQQAGQMAPTYSDRREYLEAVVDADLDEGTVNMLLNMTSRDFILSNLKDAELNEIKKLREITLKKVFAAHPSEDRIMKGKLREQVYDGGSAVKPLSQKTKIQIDQYVRGAFARVARSRDGFQQDQFGKTISASETRSADDDDGGLLNFS